MRHRVLYLFIGIIAVIVVISCGTGLLNEKAVIRITDDQIAKLCPLKPQANSNIAHLVLIVQENHSFDNVFGNYCKATPGSNPACTTGPECCEAGPAKDPGSDSTPKVSNENFNIQRDPNHSQFCQIKEIDGGKMDRYVTADNCGSPDNFAYADEATVKPYWDYAKKYALADRYFQSLAGASSSNDMYFARASFVFIDNQFTPQDAVGTGCNIGNPIEYYDINIGDLLRVCQVPFSVYAGGYNTMKAAGKGCPPKPADCPAGTQGYPCGYDASDIPFQYYPKMKDNPAIMKDLDQDFPQAIQSGTLPAVSFIKLPGYKSEHPGNSFVVGIAGVEGIINQILNSPIYSQNTLILMTYDESGGYFDHIPPPPTSNIDHQPYGPRVPLIAIGYFAENNSISHVVMEHSSIVKFIEWNWFDGSTGQLNTRDTVVNNIGSLLDPTKTGTMVP